MTFSPPEVNLDNILVLASKVCMRTRTKCGKLSMCPLFYEHIRLNTILSSWANKARLVLQGAAAAGVEQMPSLKGKKYQALLRSLSVAGILHL